MGADTNPVLGPLGLSQVEELVYRRLLRLEGGTLADLVGSASISQKQARQAVDSLEAKGLLTRSTRRSNAYIAAPPQVAIDMLILRRQEELEQVRLATSMLAAEVGREAFRPDSTEIVEVVARGEGVSNRNTQLLMGAQREILGFSLPPVQTPDESFIQFKLGILRRGVTAKVIYTPEVLEAPDRLKFIEAMRPAGEEARLAPELPTWLLIVDREVAFVPVHAFQRGHSQDHVVVHRSVLLDSLLALFHTFWDRAFPLDLGATPVVDTTTFSGDAPLTEEESRVLGLLGAGLQDSAIATQLGIGPRTVQRHVRRIMDTLGTRTRFQTGMEANRLGLIGRPVSSRDEPTTTRETEGLE